ncbi:alpha/beta fold hydrolase [Haloglycomyces albus]|uniref:alpha/beta fold hydrolase n=1 Tax=Haloglycomyces albus TaxID=526067 RepID=UPI0004B5D392|nr:alpha/beta hydrolase [Haloglycomyces albus]
MTPASSTETIAPLGKTLVAAEHETNYHDKGTGDPVVLLHGSGAGVSAWSNWAGIVDELSEHCRVIAPDIAGFGHSELKPDARYNIKLWVKHLIGILDALNLEKVSIVGNSFGGALGLATAMSHPDRIERLVLMGTPCGTFPMTDGLRAQGEFDGSRDSMERALSYFPYDASLITSDLVDKRFEAATRPGAMEAFRRLMPQPTESNPMVKGIPLERLESVEQPALILHGREDRVVPFARALDLFESLPNSQLVAFGRCGHWVQIEKRDAFMAALRDFLTVKGGVE